MKTLIILHGWQSSKEKWERVKKNLEKQGIEVIVPDLPGFRVEAELDRAWDLNDYINWFENFSSKKEKFFLLGHSFGGRIAIKFATKHPERLRGLILCGAAGIKPKPGFKTRTIFYLSKIGNAIFGLKPLRRLEDRARSLFYFFLRHKDYVKAKGVMRETIRKVLKEDLLSELCQIKTKTLIVWGQKDKMVPVKYAYILKEKIRGSRLEIIPQTGHNPNLEAPEKLSEIILDFVQDL